MKSAIIIIFGSLLLLASAVYSRMNSPCVFKHVVWIKQCEVRLLGGFCEVQFVDGTYGWVKQPTEHAKNAEYCP